MKKENKKSNVYVQPDCMVLQVQVQQMIATSGTPINTIEEYEEGSTSGWF